MVTRSFRICTEPIYGRDLKPVVQLGDDYGVWEKGWHDFPRDTWQPGKFKTPHAACWSLEGNIYVVEWKRKVAFPSLRNSSMD
jgi:hypothetical protein